MGVSEAWPTQSIDPVDGPEPGPFDLGEKVTCVYWLGIATNLLYWFGPPAVICLTLRNWYRYRRAKSRRKQGLCANCGYDLRGVSAVCPECGASTSF